MVVFFRLMKIGVMCLCLTLSGCLQSGLPISTKTKYAIDVFYDTDVPERPYEEIQWIEMANEAELQRKPRKGDRMIDQGNDAETKSLLTAQLVVKAQKMGADALIKVQYKYYTSVDSEGYSMRGLAVKYRGE
jgi:hypothetical protein